MPRTRIAANDRLGLVTFTVLLPDCNDADYLKIDFPSTLSFACLEVSQGENQPVLGHNQYVPLEITWGWLTIRQYLEQSVAS